MQSTSTWHIGHKDFLDIIGLSFTGVEDPEDMAAILARAHIIVLSGNGVYYRAASTERSNVDCIPWPKPHVKGILAEYQKPIFTAYKQNPHKHELPDTYHADMVWSQELLRKLMQGEPVSRTVTIRTRSLFGGEPQERHQVPALLPDQEMRLKMK